MFGIFNSKEHGELVLVFDIRSSSVGGALIKTNKTGVPSVLFTIREFIALKDEVKIDRLLFMTMQTLEVVVEKVFKAGFGVPKKFFCVIASPWHISQTRIINVKKDKPFVFSLDFADDLIKKEMRLFKEGYLEKYEKTKQKIRLVEMQSIRTMLNGYETHNPLDQKVEEVDMTLFISMSSDQILSAIEGVVKKYFHHEVIRFSSFTMASFNVILSLFSEQSNFLLIDIGGEVTDISMIKKNVPSESISFPMGRHFFILGIVKALSCTLAEAESYFSLLNAGHAEKTVNKKLTEIVNKLKTEWLVKFQDSLANLSRDISIPYTIYLSADKDFLHFFGQTIEGDQFNQYTLTESKFKIVFLDSETLHDIVFFEKDTLRDPFLMINAAYINHFLIYPAKTGNL
jgi:hypothetical protein